MFVLIEMNLEDWVDSRLLIQATIYVYKVWKVFLVFVRLT